MNYLQKNVNLKVFGINYYRIIAIMKNKIIRALCLLSIVTFVACSEDAIVEQTLDNGIINKVSITGADFKNEDGTRSSVSIGESGASFTWSENDTVGIFPNKGSQAEFAMSEGVGTQTATFSGGGWALKSSATYSAYYPYNFYNRDMTKIPVSYVGQTQNGNNNTDHIGAYDFMAASVATPSNGAVAFDMQHLGCLVQLKITVPYAGTLSTVTLSSDEKVFVEKGYIDLTATTPSIISTQAANSLNIDLKDIITTTTNEVVTVYFMMAPVDMLGKILTVRVGSLEGTMEAKNFKYGKAYQLSTSLKGPIAVDLGLSVKWASCNVGASSPEEYGGYYAWGETEEKSNYNEKYYKWCNGSVTTFTKYCTDSYNGTVDNKTILELEDDVAHMKWGENWRMPTSREFDELLSCTCKRTTHNGVYGLLVTGPNGNSIFLPAAGERSGTYHYYQGSIGNYWSATLRSSTCHSAYYIYFSDEDREEQDYHFRWNGYTVRPVTE